MHVLRELIIISTLSLTVQGHWNVVTHLAFSPDGARLVSCSADETVKVGAHLMARLGLMSYLL